MSDKDEISEDALRMMDSAMANWPKVSPPYDVNRFCEVLLCEGRAKCGKPATHAYPAMGGGYMSLCSEHSKQHPEAWPIKEI